MWANDPMVLKTVANTLRGRRTRRSSTRRSRRPGGDSVGAYFSDAWSLAKRTANGLNEIRKLINVEQKYIDVNSTTNTTYNGTPTYLCPIGQGSNLNSREGNSIRVIRVMAQGCIFRNNLSTANETVRLLIVRDLQNLGSSINVSDVLETIGTTTAPYQFYDMLNGPQYNSRFSIVYDELFTLNASDQNRKFYFKSDHPCHIAFRGTSNASTDAGAGSYWFIAISNTNSNTPSVDFSTRIIYTDN